MDVRVGITTSDLENLLHKHLVLQAPDGFQVESGSKNLLHKLPAQVKLSAKNGSLIVNGIDSEVKTLRLKAINAPPICISSLSRGGVSPFYAGSMELSASGNTIQMILVVNLEKYVQGVIASEIPATYQLEAIKAQTVAARTYALNPRISHKNQGFDVCDSYLCCQYFAGVASISSKQERAIAETHGQILTYQSHPILALFSSCAGGHTESYENCFSDPLSGEFPPAPLPYLTGVAEGHSVGSISTEKGLREFWLNNRVKTYDSWSPHFRWSANFSDAALEGHMHHTIEVLKDNPEFSKFITPPPSGKFGHIKRFEVTQRGLAGTAITLTVETSTGIWLFTKELTIRNIFKNSDLQLSRLLSARIFFDHQYNHLGLLSKLVVHGLGAGHGVGLQQVGAQGMALQAKNYQDILSHYYCLTHLDKLA